MVSDLRLYTDTWVESTECVRSSNDYQLDTQPEVFISRQDMSAKVIPMTAVPEKTDLLQAIQCLMDRLSSPDLTISEATDLRSRLLRLLDATSRSDRPTGRAA